MSKVVLTIFMACSAILAAADSTGPRSFTGTWQGVWQGYGTVNHSQPGSQSSLTLQLTLTAAANGELSGAVQTRGFQHHAIPNQWTRPQLGVLPHVLPPSPPLPMLPPTGKILNPRIEGSALVFQVRDPGAKLVDFRLSLHGPDAGTLSVTGSTPPVLAYPEFQMKRT